METGHFIVFEGGEGSGKSRHASALAERLRADGFEVVCTHEPGGSRIGKMIREVLLSENGEVVVPRAELLLFLADRAQHVESVIRPALMEGKVVICDRFSGSTMAYQVGGRQLPEVDLIEQADAYARNGVEPELVLFLDIDPAVGLKRRHDGDGDVNRMDDEELQFHQRVYSYFLQLSEQPHWERISTVGPREENQQRIYETVQQRLGL